MDKTKTLVSQKINERFIDPQLAIVRKATKKLARKAVQAGWDGSLITRDDRKRALEQLLKEKGFK